MTFPWLQSCTDTIADAVKYYSRVALLFSGGIESCLLLHLAAPWRSQITVYTVRTGAEFPHMPPFIDRTLSGWDHRVIAVDLGASFVEFGIPASAVPVEHMSGVASVIGIEERSPRIVPWPFCCARNRSHPGYKAIRADGLCAALHGQRAGDFPKANPSPLEYPTLFLAAPLWALSRDDVWSAVESFGVELPAHYAEYASSLDCAVCPASLTTERRAWMAHRYPEPLAIAEGLHGQVREAVLSALDGDDTRKGFVVR